MGTIFKALEKSNQCQENEQLVIDHLQTNILLNADEKEDVEKNGENEFLLFKENIDSEDYIQEGFLFPEEYQMKI